MCVLTSTNENFKSRPFVDPEHSFYKYNRFYSGKNTWNLEKKLHGNRPPTTCYLHAKFEILVFCRSWKNALTKKVTQPSWTSPLSWWTCNGIAITIVTDAAYILQPLSTLQRRNVQCRRITISPGSVTDTEYRGISRPIPKSVFQIPKKK